jgi:serine/threonine protein kinase
MYKQKIVQTINEPETSQQQTIQQQQTPQPIPELINEGGYGCIFKPHFKCKDELNEEYPSDNYISKIQIKDSVLENEVEIANLIKEIPLFEYYFSPIIKTCEIEMGKTKDTQNINQCNLIKYKEDAKKYISSKIKYVGKYDLKDFIQTLKENPIKTIELKIIDLLFYLINSLEKLNAKNIVHNDIKDNNILFDEDNIIPIFIDFGLSFKKKTFKEYEQKNNFIFTEKPYPFHNLDQNVINHIFYKKDLSFIFDPITQENTLKKIMDNFLYDDNSVTAENIFFNHEELEEIKANNQKKINQWMTIPEPQKRTEKSREEMFNKIFEKVHLWDYYSLFVCFLFSISDNQMTEKQLQITEFLKRQIILQDETEIMKQKLTELKNNLSRPKPTQLYLLEKGTTKIPRTLPTQQTPQTQSKQPQTQLKQPALPNPSRPSITIQKPQ